MSFYIQIKVMKRSLALSSGQYRHCHKVSDQDEPVVQDVIMKIFKKIGKCDSFDQIIGGEVE